MNRTVIVTANEMQKAFRYRHLDAAHRSSYPATAAVICGFIVASAIMIPATHNAPSAMAAILPAASAATKRGTFLRRPQCKMSCGNEGKVPPNIAESVASDSSLDIDGYRDVVLLRPRRGGRSGGERRGQQLSAWKFIRLVPKTKNVKCWSVLCTTSHSLVKQPIDQMT